VKVLLIDALAANDGTRRFTRDAIGAGPRMISGILENEQIETKIIRAEEFLEKREKFEDVELFFISGMSVDVVAVEKVLKKIRKNAKPIVLGGPIASDIDTIIHLSPDFAVVGEGENILSELIKVDFNFKELEKEKSEKFFLRKEGKTLIAINVYNDPLVFEKFSPSTKRIKDYPDYGYSKVYVEVVRGCSNHYRGAIVRINGGCTNCGNCDTLDSIKTTKCPVNIPPGCGFCSVPSVFGPPRSKKEKEIVNEIEQLFEFGVRRIVLSAPGFLDYMRERENKPLVSPTFPPANAEAIKSLLKKLAKVRDRYVDRTISIENVKPRLVTEEIAQIIGEYLPYTTISIGCETFDKKHSDAIGRPSSPKDSLRAASLFRKYGLLPQIYLIHSLPGETPASIETTIRTIKGSLSSIAEKITIYRYQELPLSPFKVIKVKKPVNRFLLHKKKEELKRVIINFNKAKKREMIGKKIRAVVAEYDAIHNDFICYPLYGGPTIVVSTIEEKKHMLGQVVDIKITAVIGDKLVKGILD